MYDILLCRILYVTAFAATFCNGFPFEKEGNCKQSCIKAQELHHTATNSLNMSIDISTHQLAEQTWKALGGKATLEDILTIWHAIGNSLIRCSIFSFD